MHDLVAIYCHANSDIKLIRAMGYYLSYNLLFAAPEGYSIHVRNLPYDATVGQLEKEFKKFGPIKRDGIQVRSSKVFFICIIHFLIQLIILWCSLTVPIFWLSSSKDFVLASLNSKA